jgi:hypothetical protein
MAEPNYTKLIDYIINATRSNKLVWSIYSSTFSSDTKRYYESKIGNDTIVRFEISLDQSFKYSDCGYFIIINSNLIDGRSYLYQRNYPNLDILAKLIYDLYIKKTIVIRPRDNSNVVDDIIKSLPTKDIVRDEKIDEILDSNETKKWKIWNILN